MRLVISSRRRRSGLAPRRFGGGRCFSRAVSSVVSFWCERSATSCSQSRCSCSFSNQSPLWRRRTDTHAKDSWISFAASCSRRHVAQNASSSGSSGDGSVLRYCNKAFSIDARIASVREESRKILEDRRPRLNEQPRTVFAQDHVRALVGPRRLIVLAHDQVLDGPVGPPRLKERPLIVGPEGLPLSSPVAGLVVTFCG